MKFAKEVEMRVLIISVLAGTMAASISGASAEDWMVRVVTTSRTCNVQLKTASSLGADFKGPFPSRKAACQEAKNQYDKDFSNQSKCWTYGGGTVSGCNADGVSLPQK
jgi:hypothetical protein